MALSDRKITDSQISTNGVVSAPDELKGTIPENKAIFDKLIKEAVKVQLNGLIDDLIATTAAAQIGASAPAGLTGANIQALINALNTAATAHTGNVSNPHVVTKAQVGLGNVDNTSDVGKPISTAQQAALNLKVDKVAGKGLSTNDYDNAEKAKVAQIDSKANTADVLTKTNTTAFTPTADYHPCTKVYADNIAAAAGAVASVFGRAGAVVAQAGDYTAVQVGARPDDWMPTVSDIGAAPATHSHTRAQVGVPSSIFVDGGYVSSDVDAWVNGLTESTYAHGTTAATNTPYSSAWILECVVVAANYKKLTATNRGDVRRKYEKIYAGGVGGAWAALNVFVNSSAPTNPVVGELWAW